ncbi:hypothetical protein [Thalassospira lucentensis]|uniref:hypothetical protein n=1 Tax=Thalassospira lucentensis TaxID=168935 RepID=UPI003D2E6FD7
MLGQNPYHDPYVKPHPVDIKLLKRRCVEVLRVLVSGINDYNYTEYGESGVTKYFIAPNVFTENRKTVEADVVRGLMEIAIYVRTLDDICRILLKADLYTVVQNELNNTGDLGVNYGKGAEVTLRFCCNKIIHAQDVRPVYFMHDDSGVWSMNGDIELIGFLNAEEWCVSINMFNFLEGVFKLCDVLEKAELFDEN